MAAKLLILILFNITGYIILLSYLHYKEHIPIFKLMEYFFCGILMTIPLVLLLYTNIDKFALLATFGFLSAYFIMAWLEEAAKLLPNLIAFHGKKYSHPIIPFLCVGLGFSYMETILYCLHIRNTYDLILVNFSRLLLDSSLHAVSTIACGLVFLHLLKKFKNHQFICAQIGILVGTFIHVGFNLLQIMEMQYLLVPFLIGLFYILKYYYEKVFDTHMRHPVIFIPQLKK